MNDKVIHKWIDDSGNQWILRLHPSSGLPALLCNDILIKHGGPISHEFTRLAESRIFWKAGFAAVSEHNQTLAKQLQDIKQAVVDAGAQETDISVYADELIHVQSRGGGWIFMDEDKWQALLHAVGENDE